MGLAGVKLRRPLKPREKRSGVIGEMGGKVTITSFGDYDRSTLSFPTPDWGSHSYFLRTKPGCEYTVVYSDWTMLGIVVRIVNSNTSKEFAVFFNIFGYTQVSDLRSCTDPGSDFEGFFVPWVEFVKSLPRTNLVENSFCRKIPTRKIWRIN